MSKSKHNGVAPEDAVAKFGADTLSLMPEAAQSQLVQEVKDWADYVKLANIEPMG